jgi:hypothetical protein
MRSRRVDEAAAAQRQQLAQTMSGIDWDKGPTSQQIAAMGTADPDTMRQVLTQLAENRRAAAQVAATTRGQDITKGTTERGQDITAGTTTRGQDVQEKIAARSDERIREEGGLTRAQQEKLQAERLAAEAAKPQSTQGAVAYDASKGLLTPDERARALEPPTKPATVKALDESKTAYSNHAQAVEDLEKAREILGRGINTGPMAGLVTGAANISGGYLGDKQKAQDTIDFNNLINARTIQRMSETLKGASTDFEMKKFIEVFNNPSASDAERLRAVNGLLTGAKVGMGIHANAIKQLGGDTRDVDAIRAQGKVSAEKSPEDAAAAEWAAKNPNDPRAAEIKKRLGVP